MTDEQTMPNWVLIEAAKRSGFIQSAEFRRANYQELPMFRALCDMILKHEHPPVDRKLLCAREGCAQRDKNKAYQYRTGERDEYDDVQSCVRAIELWEEGFGK